MTTLTECKICNRNTRLSGHADYCPNHPDYPVTIDPERSTRYGGKTSQGYTLEDLQRLRDWMEETRTRTIDLIDRGHQPEENTAMSTESKALAQSAVYEAKAALERAKTKHAKSRTKVLDAEARLDAARTALERLNWPTEPKTGKGVVTFTRRIGARLYTYAAVGGNAGPYDTGARWYLTGEVARSMSWEELMEFAGESGRRTLGQVDRVRSIGTR